MYDAKSALVANAQRRLFTTHRVTAECHSAQHPMTRATHTHSHDDSTGAALAPSRDVPGSSLCAPWAVSQRRWCSFRSSNASANFGFAAQVDLVITWSIMGSESTLVENWVWEIRCAMAIFFVLSTTHFGSLSPPSRWIPAPASGVCNCQGLFLAQAPGAR